MYGSQGQFYRLTPLQALFRFKLILPNQEKAEMVSTLRWLSNGTPPTLAITDADYKRNMLMWALVINPREYIFPDAHNNEFDMIKHHIFMADVYMLFSLLVENGTHLTQFEQMVWNKDRNGCTIFNFIFLAGYPDLLMLVMAKMGIERRGKLPTKMFTNTCSMPDIPLVQSEGLYSAKDMIFWNIKNGNHKAIPFLEKELVYTERLFLVLLNRLYSGCLHFLILSLGRPVVVYLFFLLRALG